MEQVGFVKKVNGEKVEVAVKRISACGDNCKSCGGACNKPAHIVNLPNTVNAKVGDYVEIKGKTKNILKYAMIVYMIPFIMLLIGIVISMEVLKKLQIANYEMISFLIGLIFLGGSYFIVKKIDKIIEKKEEDTMEILRIL